MNATLPRMTPRMKHTYFTAPDGPEITYDEAAEIIGVSPRAVRDVLKQHWRLCPPIRYSYRKIRFPFVGVLAVQAARRFQALAIARPKAESRKRIDRRKGVVL